MCKQLHGCYTCHAKKTSTQESSYKVQSTLGMKLYILHQINDNQFNLTSQLVSYQRVKPHSLGNKSNQINIVYGLKEHRI